MKVTHLRFDNTFLATLARLREKREQFQRLLADHPIRLRMKTRTKNPEADLRRQYKKVFRSFSVPGRCPDCNHCSRTSQL